MGNNVVTKEMIDMKLKKNQSKQITALIMMLVFICMLSGGCSKPVPVSEPLATWNNGETQKRIIEYVTEVKKSVPVEDRIAVFDMDGTIVCEKPLWLEMNVALMHMYREVEEDPSLKDQKIYEFVYEFVQDPLNPTYQAEFETYVQPILLESYDDVSQEIYISDVETFINDNKNKDYDILLSKTFYEPMLELITYLMDSEFKVYIVSGSEEGLIWGVTKGTLPLERDHLIGSRLMLAPDYNTSDVLVRGNAFYEPKNLKDGKTENIYYQLGEKPIFACGNSVDDFGMLSYASTNTEYPSLGLLVNHDDAEREYVYPINERHESIDWQAIVKDKGWHVISIKGDFETVFMQ